MRSTWVQRFMSKEKELPLGRGVEGAALDGGGVGAALLGCCSGGYHLPSDACHQPGPFDMSLIIVSHCTMGRGPPNNWHIIAMLTTQYPS
jgi:hypothetical protein